MIPLMLITLIVINIKQDVLDGRAAAGIEPGTFSPRRFLESPGAEQRPAHQAKIWGWDTSSKATPKCIQRKIYAPKFSGGSIGPCSKILKV